MKKSTITKHILGIACVLAITALPNISDAQTANMTATAEVQNTLTLATPSQLNFGTVAAIADTTETATITVDTAGTITTGTTGAPAASAIVDNTAVANGQVTVADGADGATLNITIDNVINPTNGVENFVLDDFETSWNGDTAETQVIGTAFTEVFTSAFGGGTNTLDIGATITTTTVAAGAYSDGTYSGSYDVIFSY